MKKSVDLLNIEKECGFGMKTSTILMLADMTLKIRTLTNVTSTNEIQKLPKKAFNADSLEAARGETSQGLGLPDNVKTIIQFVVKAV